jgi:hypothetical protein
VSVIHHDFRELGAGYGLDPQALEGLASLTHFMDAALSEAANG